ncbi:MAG TPA: sulfite exporter TauE/SafE family protein [Albitalea sp.]|nr:sulfite exporter TauE/SafE family protein [Albitalea sp.]
MPAFDFNPWLLAAIGAVFLLAGFVKGVVGLGLPTITMGLLSVAMPPAQAAALLVVPSLVTNVWQIAARPGLAALLRRMATMLIGVCGGIAAGAGWLTGGASSQVTTALGLALLAYAALGLLSVHLQIPPRHERWLSPLVGAATGLVTAATGVFVMPAVPYLQALGLAKEELVQALGISFLVSTLALAASLGHGGALPLSAASGSALALLPALAGMGLGQRLRRRVKAALFKRLFFSGLLALGAYLSLRAWL